MPNCLDSLFEGESPFDRLIAFEVYDGPIVGVVLCCSGGDAGFFRLLAWDDSQERRVFALSPLPQVQLVALVSALAETQDARWPEWWLGYLDEPTARAKVADAILEVSSEAGATTHVVVSKNLLSEIEGVTALTGDAERSQYERLSKRSEPSAEVSDAPFVEWLAFIDGV